MVLSKRKSLRTACRATDIITVLRRTAIELGSDISCWFGYNGNGVMYPGLCLLGIIQERNILSRRRRSISIVSF